MRVAKAPLWACVVVTLFVSCCAGDTPDWPDEDLIAVFEDSSPNRRYKRLAEYQSPTTSAYHFTTEGSGVPEESPCDVGPSLCNGPEQVCVTNSSLSGGYHCQCTPAYEQSNGSDTCVEIPPSRHVYLTTPLDTITFSPSSEEFLTFQRSCDYAFKYLLGSIRNFQNLHTLEFRRGSGEQTVVVYAIYFNTTVTNVTLSAVSERILSVERDGHVVIGGNMYNITQYTGIFLTYNATFTESDDVDWCSQPSLNSCNNGIAAGQNRRCVDGGLRYTCPCNSGFLDARGVCAECTNNTYSTNCSSQCLCNVTNTVSCDHVTGNCTCKQGWTSLSCDADFDECSTNAYNCSGPYESCVNTIGSYDCVCSDGYNRNTNNICSGLRVRGQLGVLLRTGFHPHHTFVESPFIALENSVRTHIQQRKKKTAVV